MKNRTYKNGDKNMAFFNDLGKKLSQAGQTAVQKTKGMTEIARLNGAISEQEKKLTDTYFEIGKLYVLKHPKDYENDFAVMIAALKESERKIKEYRQQIQDVKGIVRCEKCGAEVANNVAFCSSCGAKIVANTNVEHDENIIKCSNCGAMMDKNVKFCISCGKQLSAVQQEVTSKYDIATEPIKATIMCSNCGAKMADDTVFCTQCGNKKQ